MTNNEFQETILNFIHDSYHDQNGSLFVPEHLRMSKDISNTQIAATLRSYRTTNRYNDLSIWYIFMNMLCYLYSLLQNINYCFYMKAFCERGRLLSYFRMDKEDPKVMDRDFILHSLEPASYIWNDRGS